MDQYRRGELVFDVIDAGLTDGPVVILLHGFPQMNTSWDAVIPKLTARGYRCLAPNQRGYSRGARPTRRRDYRMSELVGDVRTLIDSSGAQRVHLVGHDFGALVTWFAAAQMPDRLATASALSTPHPIGGLKALVSSRQAFASWYVYVFQLPRIPERVFVGSRGTATGLSKFLRAHGQTPECAERDARAMAAPGAFTAAVNWYRAMPLNDFLRLLRTKITVPTMHVFSDGDTFLSAEGAHACGRGVSGEYRFEMLHGSLIGSLTRIPVRWPIYCSNGSPPIPSEHKRQRAHSVAGRPGGRSHFHEYGLGPRRRPRRTAPPGTV